MKNLITCTACVILLMAFLTEFIHQQSVFIDLALAGRAIETFETAALEEGEITKEHIDWICRKLSVMVKCTAKEIEVKTAQVAVSGGTGIQYEISFPVGGILASPGFWGVEESDNYARHKVTGEIMEKKGKEAK